VICFLTAFTCVTATAQTPTPSPTPTEEELRLQEEKRVLDLKKAIEENKKAIRDAQPKPSATPLSGDTTLTEGVRLETEIVSYKAMAEAAKLISTEIHGKITTATNIAIYDGQTIKDWRFYQSVSPGLEGYIKDLRQRYLTLFCSDNDTDPQIRAVYCPAGSPLRQAGYDSARALAVIPPAVIPEAFAAGSTFLRSFIDLAALFRTDTKIEGKSVTIDQNALVAEVLRRLKGDYASINLYNPGMFPPRTDSSSPTVTIIGELFLFKKEADRLIKIKNQAKPAAQATLDQHKAELKAYQDELEMVESLLEKKKNLQRAYDNEHNPKIRAKLFAQIARVAVQLGALKTKAELEALIAASKITIQGDQAAVKSIDAAVKALTELNDRFQSFIDEFLKVGANGTNTLALFIKSEDIDQIMNNDTSYWLEIRSVSAGGNNRTRKNLIWFFAGARVDHSGGVILEYTLYDKTGAVVYSDKLSHYEGYVQPKEMRKKKTRGQPFEDPQ
jgi:hypothetical protein